MIDKDKRFIPAEYTDDGYTRWYEERTGESIVVESEQLAVDRKIELLELQGNTWQNPNDLNEIKSVGELYVNELGEPILDGGGKEQYKIELESRNDAGQTSKTTILLPQPLMSVGSTSPNNSDRLYWDDTKGHYCIEKKIFFNNIYEMNNSSNLSLKTTSEFTTYFETGYKKIIFSPQITDRNMARIGWNNAFPNVQTQYNVSYGNGNPSSKTNSIFGANNTNCIFSLLNSDGYTTLDNTKTFWDEKKPYLYYLATEFQIIDLPHLNIKFTVSTYSPKTYILNSSNGLSGNMIVKVPFEKPPDPPTRPTGVTFTRGESGSHIISWNESTGASGGYKVYVGEVLLTDTKALTYTHTGELKGFLKVVAYNVAYQTESDLVLVETQPNKPTNFNATNVPSGSNIRFTVNFMDNSYIETGYKVKYKIDRANEVTLNVSPFASTGDAAYSFDVPVTQVGVEMSIKLLAYNETGESYAENTVVMVTQKPNAPTDFAVALIESSSSYLFNVSFKDASDTELGHRIKYQMDKGSEMVIDIPPTDKGAIIARELTVPIKNINNRIEFRVCSYNQAGETYHDLTLYYTKPANLSITTVGIATTIAWDTIQGIDGCNILLDGKIVETATTNTTTINHELYGVLTVVPFVGSVNHMASRQELIHTMPNTPLHTDIGYVETQLGYDVTVGFVDNSNIETHYRVDVRIDNGEKKSIDIDTEFGEIPPNATLDDKRTDIMWLYENETQGNDVSFKGIDGLLVKDLKLQGNTVGGKNLGQDEVITIVNRENETPIRFITEVVSSGEVRIPCIGRNQHLSMIARGNNVNPNIHINNNTYSSSLTYIDGHTDASTLESTTRYGYIVGRVNAIFDTLHKNRVVYRTGEYVLTGREAWAVDLAKTTDSTTTISSVTLSNCSSLLPQDTIEMISNRMTPVAYNAIGNHLDFAYTTKMYVSFSNSEVGITADDSTPNKVLKCKQYILSNVLKLRYILAKPTEEVINIEVFKGEAFTLMNGDSLDLSTKKVTLNSIEKDIYLIDEVANKMVENIPLERTSIVSIGDAIKGSFETSLVIEPELSSADTFEILVDNRVKFTQGSTALYGNPINGKSQVEVATLSGNNTINIKGAIKPTLIQGSFPAIKYVSTTFPVDVFKDNINVHVTSCNAIGENAFADSLTKYMSPTPIWTYKQGKIVLQWIDLLTDDTAYSVRYKINGGSYHYDLVGGDGTVTGNKFRYEFVLGETDYAEVSICARMGDREGFYSKSIHVSKGLDTTLAAPTAFISEWVTKNEVKFTWTDDTRVEDDFEFVYTIDNGAEMSAIIPSTSKEETGATYSYTLTLNELETVVAKVRMRWALNTSEFATKTVLYRLDRPEQVQVAMTPEGTVASWAASPLATLYKVFLEGVEIGSTSETHLTIAVEMIGNLYVVAYKDHFSSAPSDGVYVKTKPNAPVNLDVEFLEVSKGYDFNITFVDNSNLETDYRVKYRVDGGDETIIPVPNSLYEIGDTIRISFHVDVIQSHISISVVAVNEVGESEIANPQSIYLSPTPKWTYLLDEKKVLLYWTDAFDFETSYKIQYSINGGGYRYETVTTSGNVLNSVIHHKMPLDANDTMVARICCVSEKDHLYGPPVTMNKALDDTLAPPSDFDYVWLGKGHIQFSWTDNHTIETGYEFSYSINEGVPTVVTLPTTDSAGVGNIFTYEVRLEEMQRIKAMVRMVWALNTSDYAMKSTQYIPSDATPVQNLRRRRNEEGLVVEWAGQPFVEKYVIHYIVGGKTTLIETQSNINLIDVDYSLAEQVEIFVITHLVGGSISERSPSMIFTPCEDKQGMTTHSYTPIRIKSDLSQVITGICRSEYPLGVAIWSHTEERQVLSVLSTKDFLTCRETFTTIIQGKDLQEVQAINAIVYSPGIVSVNPVGTIIYTQTQIEKTFMTAIYTMIKEAKPIVLEINKPRIATFGDSITSGQPGYWNESQTGDVRSQYQYWLDKRLKGGYEVVNKGYGRDNSAQLLARFRRELAPLNAHYNIIQIGTNDIFEAQKDNQGSQETLDLYLANLRNNVIEMINISKELKVEPMIGNLIPRTGFKGIYREALWSHNRWLLQYCTENKIAYINFYDAGKSNLPPTPLESPTEPGAMNEIFDGDTQYDSVGNVIVKGNGIHPNWEGYKLMGEAIPLSLFQTKDGGMKMYKDKECMIEEKLDETNIIQKVYMVNMPNMIRGKKKFTTRYIKNLGSDQLMYVVFPMEMENCQVSFKVNDGAERDIANGIAFARGVHKLDIYVEVPMKSELPALHLGIATRAIL